MAATLIAETDVIEVSSITMLIYGSPGAWKTSTAQTAVNPITLDFDRGIHRSFNRKTAIRFDFWDDVEEKRSEIEKRQTIIIDTVGRCLDMISADVIKGGSRFGTATTGLTQQGYGALKSRFAQWIANLRLVGKDIVFLAHEREEKDGDQRYMRPDIQGSSCQEVMKLTDVVGYLGTDQQGRRFFDCNSTDRHHGKNPARWSRFATPDLKVEPAWLAGLIADVKKLVGTTAAASAHAAMEHQEWSSWLATKPDLATFNGRLPKLSEMSKVGKKPIWDLLQAHAKSMEWIFDRVKLVFIVVSKVVLASNLPAPDPAKTNGNGAHPPAVRPELRGGYTPGVDDPDLDPEDAKVCEEERLAMQGNHSEN